jgi:hypothetical protein
MAEVMLFEHGWNMDDALMLVTILNSWVIEHILTGSQR